jgi:hypothetical protein
VELLLPLVVGGSFMVLVRNNIIINLIVLCHLVMFVIAVDRKVRMIHPLRHFTHIYIQGHWIQDCPTNSDREFDNKPRIKRTTGIPRSMLKAVDNPNSGQLGQGVMVTPEGGYVVAQPDLYVI